MTRPARGHVRGHGRDRGREPDHGENVGHIEHLHAEQEAREQLGRTHGGEQPDHDAERREAEGTRDDLPGDLTPYTTASELLNREDTEAAFTREYPAALKEGGIGGTARVDVLVDVDGVVQDVRISDGTGYQVHSRSYACSALVQR
jgi:hypothetical protein